MADNLRIPQLNSGIPGIAKSTVLLAGYDSDDNLTKPYSIEEILSFVPEVTSFRWDAGTSYAIGAIVEWNDKLWESLVGANLGNTPTEGANWTEVSKSVANGAIPPEWTAGIYITPKTIVNYNLKFFKLKDAVTLPFDSITNPETDTTNWDQVGGSGGTPTTSAGAVNQMQKADGAGGLLAASMFEDAAGQLQLGDTTIAVSEGQLRVESSLTDADLKLIPWGAGDLILDLTGGGQIDIQGIGAGTSPKLSASNLNNALILDGRFQINNEDSGGNITFRSNETDQGLNIQAERLILGHATSSFPEITLEAMSSGNSSILLKPKGSQAFGGPAVRFFNSGGGVAPSLWADALNGTLTLADILAIYNSGVGSNPTLDSTSNLKMLTINSELELGTVNTGLSDRILRVSSINADSNLAIELQGEGVVRIEGGGLELQGVASALTSPLDGTLWYRTDTDDLYLRSNGVDRTVMVSPAEVAYDFGDLNLEAVGGFEFNSIRQTLKMAHVQLTQAQILAFTGTPIEVIPAPGANKYIEIISASAKLTHVTTAFTGGDNLELEINGVTIMQTGAGFIDAGADRVEKLDFSGAGNIIAENTAVDAHSTNDVTAGGGTSTIDIYVVYNIIDVSI